MLTPRSPQKTAWTIAICWSQNLNGGNGHALHWCRRGIDWYVAKNRCNSAECNFRIRVCRACRTYEIARESWDVETHPMICVSLHVNFLLIFWFSFLSFCSFFILINVFHILFWIFSQYKIWILLIIFYLLVNVIFLCTCLPLSRSVLSYHQLGGSMKTKLHQLL